MTSLYPLKSLCAIQLTGDKTREFLQGQLTCDMNQLKMSGDYSLAACCNPKGRMLANFWVLQRATDFLLILPIDMREIVITHLTKYAIFSRVTLKAYDDYTLMAADNTERFALEKQFDDSAFFITLPNPSRHIILTTQTTNKTADDNAWVKNNITDKFCLITPSTTGLFTPQMINLEKQGGVSFEKGCYVGQEIVARTQYLGKLKRHLHHVRLKRDTCPEPGDALMNTQQEQAGIIASAILSAPNTVEVLAVIEDRLLESVQESL